MPKAIELLLKCGNDISIYYERNDSVEETISPTTYYYSRKNGKEIKEIADLFIEGYDYENFFKNVYLRRMLNAKRAPKNIPAVTDEELEIQYQNTKFIFDGIGNGIYVLNDELGDYYFDEKISYANSKYEILFSAFDQDVLNI